ncbi:MAG: hypothetical protein R3E87_15050 [Burkholderiaceae bacterium]
MRDWPALRWLVAIPNGGKRDRVTAKMMVAEGATAGVADLLWPLRRGPHAGIAIELKKLDGGDGLTGDQLDYLKFMHGEGWAAYCCHGSARAIDLLVQYEAGNLAPTVGPVVIQSDGLIVPAYVGAGHAGARK